MINLKHSNCYQGAVVPQPSTCLVYKEFKSMNLGTYYFLKIPSAKVGTYLLCDPWRASQIRKYSARQANDLVPVLLRRHEQTKQNKNLKGFLSPSTCGARTKYKKS